jgi:hypothetical protein
MSDGGPQLPPKDPASRYIAGRITCAKSPNDTPSAAADIPATPAPEPDAPASATTYSSGCGDCLHDKCNDRPRRRAAAGAKYDSNH